MYEYRATIARWIDGDTVVLDVDLGFYTTVRQTFRLAGIDAPELRSKDPDERVAALAALEFCKRECPVLSTVTVKSKKTGKYGRWLAEVYTGVDCLNDRLVEAGHARIRD